jgi:hypothetical protein
MNISPLRLFVGSLVRALLIWLTNPLISHGWVDASTAKTFVDWATTVGWFVLAAGFASISLFWSHYRNVVLVDLKKRLDAFLGNTPAIPSGLSVPSVQSTVLPLTMNTETK